MTILPIPQPDLDRMQSELNRACSQNDQPTVQEIVDEIAEKPGNYPPEFAVSVLQTLRNARLHPELLRAANVFALAMNDDMADQRVQKRIKLHGQALIETGDLAAATAVLRPLLQMDLAQEEAREAWGLMGRIYKQSFVDRTTARFEFRVRLLSQAIEAYRKVWDFASTPKPLYQGGNLMALLFRAYKEGVEREAPKALAIEIQAEAQKIVRDGKADEWTYAILADASIALNEFENAERAIADFVAHPAVTRFSLNSSLRQYREIWQLDQDERAGKIMRTLEDALQQRAVHQATTGGTPSSLQLSIQYGSMAESARSVAMIDTGGGLGTGFLVDISGFLAEFNAKAKPEDRIVVPPQMLVTCEHVISGCQADDLKVHFTTLEGGAVSVKRIRPRSFRREFDIAFLELSEIPAGAKALQLPLHSAALSLRPNPRQPIQVLGHPQARSLEFSFLASAVSALGSDSFFFSSGLEPGSSGSPVFDEKWNVIGMYTSRRPGRDGNNQQGQSTYLDKINESLTIWDKDDNMKKSAQAGAGE